MGKKELFTGPMGLQRHQLVNISQVYLCPVTLLYSYLQFKGKDNKECCIFHSLLCQAREINFCICKIQCFFCWVINFSVTMRFILKLNIKSIYFLSVLHLLHIWWISNLSAMVKSWRLCLKLPLNGKWQVSLLLHYFTILVSAYLNWLCLS